MWSVAIHFNVNDAFTCVRIECLMQNIFLHIFSYFQIQCPSPKDLIKNGWGLLRAGLHLQLYQVLSVLEENGT